MLRRVVGRDGRSRAFINDQPVGVGAAAARSARCWWRCRASTSRWAWPTRPATPALLDAFGVPPALRDAGRGSAGAPGATPMAALEPRADGDRRGASATRNGCATRSMNWPRLAPQRRRGGAPGRRAPAPAAGRAAGRGDRRRAGRADAARPAQRRAGRRPARGVPRAAAPGPPAQPDAGQSGRAALAALERAEEALAEAETLLDAAGRRGRCRSAAAGAGRGAAVRAARGRPQAWRRGGRTAGVARYAVRAAGGAGDRRGRDGRAGAGAAGSARGLSWRPPRAVARRAGPPPARLERGGGQGTAAAAAGEGALSRRGRRRWRSRDWGPAAPIACAS